MGVKNNPQKCLYCGGCVGVCPVSAIKLNETRLEIDNQKCIDCSACVLICPIGANELVKGLKE